MHNWSVDEEKFKKEDPEGYRVWCLSQLINYGLNGEKLKREEVIKYWPRLKEYLDPYRERLFAYLIWHKLYSLPNNLTFWNLPKSRNQ